MSLNIHLHFTDSKNRSVKEIPLYQTPTKVTKEILNSSTFEDQLFTYIFWVRANIDSSYLSKIYQKINSYGKQAEEILNEDFDRMSYIAVTLPEVYLPASYQEYLRIYEIFKSYTPDYQPEFYAL